MSLRTQPKKERNRELVRRRVTDPNTWTYGTLGDFFGVGRKTAYGLFEQHVGKYATKEEIRDYRKLTAKVRAKFKSKNSVG